MGHLIPRTFDSIMGRKQAKDEFGSLFMSYAYVMNFIKGISSFVNLLASVEFNDSYGVQKWLYWA